MRLFQTTIPIHNVRVEPGLHAPEIIQEEPKLFEVHGVIGEDGSLIVEHVYSLPERAETPLQDRNVKIASRLAELLVKSGRFA